MKIKVSVIIPIYNTEKYLERCLKSILNQTLKEIEVIVINDNSKDKSRDIILEFMKLNKIVFIDKQKNEGVSCARNQALEIASGEYVVFADSDDYIEENMLEVLYKEAKKGDFDVILHKHIIDFEKENENYIRKVNFKDKKIFNKDELIKEILCQQNGIHGHSHDKFYKKRILIENKIYFPLGIQIMEDIAFNLQVFNNTISAKYIDKAFYHYIQREDSAIKKMNKKIIDDHITIINWTKEYLSKNKLNKYERDFNVLRINLIVICMFKILGAKIDKDEKIKMMIYLFDISNIRDIRGVKRTYFVSLKYYCIYKYSNLFKYNAAHIVNLRENIYYIKSKFKIMNM